MILSDGHEHSVNTNSLYLISYNFNAASLLSVTKQDLKNLSEAASESCFTSDSNIYIWSSKNPLFSLCPQAVERTEDKACYFSFPGLYFVFIGKCLPAVQSRRWINYLCGCWLRSSSSSSSSSLFLIYLGNLSVVQPAPCPGLIWSIRDIYILYISIYWEEKNAAKYNYCLEF